MVATFLPCDPGSDVNVTEGISPEIGQEAEVYVERLRLLPLMVVGRAGFLPLGLAIMCMVGAEQAVVIQSIKQCSVIHPFRMVFVPYGVRVEVANHGNGLVAK